jgi:hypothetical protein
MGASVAADNKFVDDLGFAVRPYVALIRLLIAEKITIEDFEAEFYPLFRADPVRWSDEVADRLDSFFADVDSCVADPSQRDESNHEIGPEELRESARELLRQAGHRV